MIKYDLKIGKTKTELRVHQEEYEYITDVVRDPALSSEFVFVGDLNGGTKLSRKNM